VGSVHLEALYPAVAAVIVGVLAFLKRTGKPSDDDAGDINVKTLVRALGAAEAGRQDEQEKRMRAERQLAKERALREACEDRETRRNR
jgi:hypothetical protein